MAVIGLLYIIAMIIAGVVLIGIILVLILSYQVVSLEHKGEHEKSQNRASWVLLIFILGGGGLFLLMLLAHSSIVNFVALLFLLVSGYMGWFALVRFLFYLAQNKPILAKNNFVQGVKLSPFFLISLLILWINFTERSMGSGTQSNKVSRTYDACHKKEDWLVGGECTSHELSVADVVGKWQMLHNRDTKGSYQNYYFLLKSDGSVLFHSFYVATQRGGYDEIDYMDINSTWKLHLQGEGLVPSSNPDSFHPYITINIDDKHHMLFRLDSGESKSELYLQNQYDDFDAPHYLTYNHESI